MFVAASMPMSPAQVATARRSDSTSSIAASKRAGMLPSTSRRGATELRRLAEEGGRPGLGETSNFRLLSGLLVTAVPDIEGWVIKHVISVHLVTSQVYTEV
jgi:hypothetical protein